jgi:hypothetical protein
MNSSTRRPAYDIAEREETALFLTPLDKPSILALVRAARLGAVLKVRLGGSE